MLTTEPTLEMLQEWKRLHEEYRPKLSPNRRSGAQVDAYFRETYPHTPMDSGELREMITAEILENPHHAEKLPEDCVPDVRCYLSGDVLVGIDLVTGHIHAESENMEETEKLYDTLFLYRGLDEADLENAFLTAEYVRLVQEAYGDGFLETANVMRLDERIAEKRHAKNPQNYQTAALTITAPEESDLHEITLTCIKILDSNGAWDFDVQYSEQRNVIAFKYNGTIAALDAVSRLHFQCEHDMKWDWHSH